MRSLKHYLKTTTALPIGLGVVAAGLLGGPLVEHTLAPAQALAQGENPEAVCAPACEPCAPACEPCAAACEPCGPCAAAGVMTECAVPGMENPCAVCAPCEADAMPLGAAGSLDNPEAACGPSEPCAAACAPCPAACEPCAPDAMCAAENMCAAECEPCAPDAMCAAANPDAMCAPCAPDAEAACAPCAACAAAEMPELTDEQAQALYDCIQESVAGGGWTQSEMAEGTAFLEWENFTTAPYISTTHGSRYAVNYANPVAAEQYGLYEQIEAIPEGGILAKPTFTVNAVGQALLGPLFLMERAPEGSLPASNDWIYTTINPDGSVAGRTGGVNSDAMQSCADCHMGTGAATDDLLFLPEAYRR